MTTSPRQGYDVVVVGARCAGAATAMLLARGGRNVLLIDRDRMGADTLSTLAIMRAGVLQLHRWGLLDLVRRSGAQAVRRTTFVYDGEEIAIPLKPRDGVDALYSPRRTTLDPILVDAAAAAGAEVRFGVRLLDLLRDPQGRVTGVVIEERDRTCREIPADLVIGADGMHSTVARKVGAASHREGRRAAAVVYAFWPGLENTGNQWHYRPGLSVGAIPTNGEDTCVFAATSSERFRDEIHGDLEGGYHRVLSECTPDLARALKTATPSERLRGFPGLPGYMRQCHGPGWALVGDAGYFKDPITAHGITDALRDSELLARAALRGSDRALAGYQEQRDELSGALFDITDAIAGFDWSIDDLKSLHLALSKAMNREVEALLALDGPAVSLSQAATPSHEGQHPRS